MNRWGPQAGRWVSVLGIACFAAYLAWRIGASLNGAPLWLALPALAVELVGFAAAIALVVTLWPDRRSRPVTALNADRIEVVVDVVVRVDDQSDAELRTTLLALGSAEPGRSVTVLDLRARASVAALATEFGAAYVAADPLDRSGLVAALGLRGTGAFLMLDAGDVPGLAIVDRLRGALVDPTVAIAQGRITSVTTDSAEHGPTGQHEQAFERDALNPAMGRRGSGILTGSGALVRRCALAEVASPEWLADSATAVHVQWDTSLRLVERGWHVLVVDGPPVVAVRAVNDGASVAAEREHEARAARHVLLSAQGALRVNGLGLRARIGYVAWSLRPLSGLRRLAFVGLVLAALIAGDLPFRPDATALALWWLPSFVLVAVGLSLLSGGTLRPGDRLRASLRSVGPALQSLARRRLDAAGRPARRSAVQRSLALVSIAIAINLVIAARGLSDRWTGTLGNLDPAARAGLLAVALWILAGCLDALRLLLRRAQQRRAVRVSSSMTGSLSGRAVFLTDLTMLGAGIVADRAPRTGTTMQLDAVVPTRSGVTTLSVPSVVRNVGRDISGGWRIGLEFAALDATSANALAEFCVIEPARSTLGGHAVEPIETGITIDDLAPMPMLNGQRRLLLRATTLFAVAGVVASAGPGAAEASPGRIVRITGVVTSTAATDEAQLGTTTTVMATATTSQASTTIVMPPSDASTTSAASPPVTSSPASSAPTSSSAGAAPTSTVAAVGSGDPPVPTGVAGATVVGVCSDDRGADGVYGTSDDAYTTPISTTSGEDGSYSLDLDGRACWVSLAPPPGYEAPATQIVDPSTATSRAGRISLRPAPRTAAPAPEMPRRDGSVTTLVWSDVDANGAFDPAEAGVEGVTVTLYALDGTVLSTSRTNPDGSARFAHLGDGRYEVGVTNLPEGTAFGGETSVTGRTATVHVQGDDVAVHAPLREPATGLRREADPAAPTHTLLPAPAPSQTAEPSAGGGGRLGPMVVALAGVIGASVVLGAARPHRRRALASPAG